MARTNQLSFLSNLRQEIVVRLSPSCPEVYKRLNIICLVRKSHTAINHMAKCAKNGVFEDVLGGRMSDDGPVGEHDFLLPKHFHVDRVDASRRLEHRIPAPLVAVAGPIDQHIRHWRVMGYLLHVDCTAVFQVCLICFTDDRVQRFSETVSEVDITD